MPLPRTTLAAASGAGFEAFGPSHLVMIAVFLAGVPAVIWLGRRVRDTPGERRTSRIFAVAVCAFTITMQVIDFLPGNFDLQTTLPLQLCDLAWMVLVWALWTRSVAPGALAFYWGLTLTTQAILTPWLQRDFPDPKFIGFWGMHLLIVWGAIYLAWGLGRRPGWRGFRFTVAVTLAWMVAVYGFNLAAGTNYGFVNHKPSDPSVLDYLGPWPGYLVAEIAIVAAVWALMTLLPGSPTPTSGRRKGSAAVGHAADRPRSGV